MTTAEARARIRAEMEAGLDAAIAEAGGRLEAEQLAAVRESFAARVDGIIVIDSALGDAR
jgi:hypothetical protein